MRLEGFVEGAGARAIGSPSRASILLASGSGTSSGWADSRWDNVAEDLSQPKPGPFDRAGAGGLRTVVGRGHGGRRVRRSRMARTRAVRRFLLGRPPSGPLLVPSMVSYVEGNDRGVDARQGASGGENSTSISPDREMATTRPSFRNLMLVLSDSHRDLLGSVEKWSAMWGAVGGAEDRRRSEGVSWFGGSESGSDVSSPGSSQRLGAADDLHDSRWRSGGCASWRARFHKSGC